jgi:novobiocin biosynthesis protein NovU/D-mycarose 3-C-methyltransferase
MPLANSFPSSHSEFASEARYPLAVTACRDCGLIQLNYVVPAEQLYRDYIYVSSTSEGVRAHADRLAETLIAQYGWSAEDTVLEVASNDGTVLKAFQRRAVRVLGVEPARNIAEIAARDGIPTVPEFFNLDTARGIRAERGPVQAILGRHVFAHVDDVHGFIEGVDVCLAEHGVFVIEVPYLGDLLEKLEFDTVYHEHLSYVSLDPMQRLCERHGFELVDIERASLHGGSIVLHMQRAGIGRPSPRLAEMLAAERRARLTAPDTLSAFVTAVQQWKSSFERMVAELVASNHILIGYGAAAKANTLLNYCPGVASALAVILDRSPLKHGRYTPGTHILVEPVERWPETGAEYMVILAWNFADEIIRQMQAFENAGGRFIVPIPAPQVIG